MSEKYEWTQEDTCMSRYKDLQNYVESLQADNNLMNTRVRELEKMVAILDRRTDK